MDAFEKSFYHHSLGILMGHQYENEDINNSLVHKEHMKHPYECIFPLLFLRLNFAQRSRLCEVT